MAIQKKTQAIIDMVLEVLADVCELVSRKSRKTQAALRGRLRLVG